LKENVQEGEGMRLNRSEQKELLEDEAHLLLYALYHSQPIGRDETPEVYLREGTLAGMCRVFGAYFEVDLRRKITFYKGIYVGEGKYWFEVVNEYLSEEDAKHRIEYMKKQMREITLMRQNRGF